MKLIETQIAGYSQTFYDKEEVDELIKAMNVYKVQAYELLEEKRALYRYVRHGNNGVNCDVEELGGTCTCGLDELLKNQVE